MVYVPGSFDLLTPGVIRLLRRASELGDFVLAGIYSDEEISQNVGNPNYPFLGSLERTLNLLSLKYVQDVIIGVPTRITSQFVIENKVDVIFLGEEFMTEYISQIEFEPDLAGMVVREKAKDGFPLEVLLERIE